MADKFFHEFPTTTTLKDNSILLLDQDNQTTAITLAQLKSFLGGGSYTTVGNASAGIFVKAECFTSGSGNWVAPEGCTSARVTVVGGGGGQTLIWSGATYYSGSNSKFNYTGNSITGTSKNELIGQGAYNVSHVWYGGGAGWNGLSVLGGSSIGTSPTPVYPEREAFTIGQGFTDAQGKVGNGGFGGGGGYGGGGKGVSLGRNALYSTISFQTYAGGGSVYSFTRWKINVSWLGSGGSGGINGNSQGILGGGSPIFSHAAYNLSNFTNIINTCGDGIAAGGWCTAVVNVIAGQPYSYTVGSAGNNGGNGGIVLIEY
jgi:hypothetical protein